VNSLVKAMDDHGIAANANVWCELGTTWREVMNNPTEAAHVMGKLLNRVGQDRVMWGTDGLVPKPYERIGYVTWREVLRWWNSMPAPEFPV
jgi:predicted TIM-barrel fold metal-dependent hydrolase